MSATLVRPSEKVRTAWIMVRTRRSSRGVGTGHEDAERVEEECERDEGGDTDRRAGECRGDRVDDAGIDERERADDSCRIDRDQRDHRQGKRGEGAEATRVRGAHAQTGRHERGERIGVETVPAQTHAVPESEDG